MTLQEDYALTYGGPFPSFLANALQKMLSLSAFQFVVDRVDDTHVQVAAGAGDQAAAIAIGGKWRWNEATVGPIAVPGGGAATFPVFATCADNVIVSTPAPFTDNTNYAFGIQVKPFGGTPTIVPGTVDFYRHVADIEWDGSRIQHITQLVPATPDHSSRHVIGGLDPIRGMNQIGKRLVGDVNCFVPGSLAAGTYWILSDGSLSLVTNPLPLSKAWEHWWLSPLDYLMDNITGHASPTMKLGLRATAAVGTHPGAGITVKPWLITPGNYTVSAGKITPAGTPTEVSASFAVATVGLLEVDSFGSPVLFRNIDFPGEVWAPAIQIVGGSTAAGTDMRINLRAYAWFDTDDAPTVN